MEKSLKNSMGGRASGGGNKIFSMFYPFVGFFEHFLKVFFSFTLYEEFLIFVFLKNNALLFSKTCSFHGKNFGGGEKMLQDFFSYFSFLKTVFSFGSL